MALLPALVVFDYFLECFASAEQTIGRERELVADREGASVSGPRAFASALVKVCAFAGVWNGFEKVATEALLLKKMYVNASKMFHGVVCRDASPKDLEGLATTRVNHPTDSHPQLAVRLENLGETMEGVREAVLMVDPERPAIGLVPDVEPIEEGLMETYQAVLARRMRIPLGASDTPATAPSA